MGFIQIAVAFVGLCVALVLLRGLFKLALLILSEVAWRVQKRRRKNIT